MKAIEWIDRVKAAKGIESDYGVAKLLRLTPQSVSGYRSKTPTMNEETSIKVAEALGVEPARVLLDQIAEATKDKSLRTTLFGLANGVSVLCKLPEECATKLIAAYSHVSCAKRLFT